MKAKQGAVLPIDEAPVTRDVTLQATPKADPIVALMLERANEIDVEKLRQIIELQEHILDRNAESAFNAAFARMQPEIPTIRERARTDKTTYAPLEDIVETVRPILSKHGFTLSFQTEWPDKKTVKVTGILTHLEGHARKSEFLSDADTGPGRNAIQALGSAVTYGKRYTAKDLLCIVTRDEDDDARRWGRPDPPEGYDDWWSTLTATADNGIAVLEKMWLDTKNKAFKEYARTHGRREYQALKDRASKVKAS